MTQSNVIFFGWQLSTSAEAVYLAGPNVDGVEQHFSYWSATSAYRSQ
jgi:hypothetical protein